MANPIVTITMENGDVMEHGKSCCFSGHRPAKLPWGENEDDPDNGLVILKVIHEDGEDLLSTLDSDEELEAVYEQFMELLFDEDEE